MVRNHKKERQKGRVKLKKEVKFEGERLGNFDDNPDTSFRDFSTSLASANGPVNWWCKTMSFERIEPSPLDKEFRKAVKKAIDSGRNEIVVIAGELGSYGFSELKQAAGQAKNRGVRIKIYSTEAAPADVVEEIRQAGGEIYIGETFVKDHYLVIDRNMFIVSEKKVIGRPTKIGTRKARFYRNRPKDAKRIVKFFDDLIRYDFMKRSKEKSRVIAFADTILEAFIPNYAKLPKEPTING